MAKAVIPSNDQPPEPRRGLLARIFSVHDDDNAMERLRADHALARLAIELDADLKRHRRKAQHYLEVTALEDRAAKEIAKVERFRDICEAMDEIFADDPVNAAVFKARVRAIFNPPRNGHRPKHPWTQP